MPRTSTLTAEVPAGALVTAVRQLVLFANPSPTGWRQIGMSAFKPFAPETDTPFYCVQGMRCNFHAHPQMTLRDCRHQGIPKGARYVSPFNRNRPRDRWPVYSGYGAHWHNRDWPVPRGAMDKLALIEAAALLGKRTHHPPLNLWGLVDHCVCCAT